jgi:hypothetical protein
VLQTCASFNHRLRRLFLDRTAVVMVKVCLWKRWTWNQQKKSMSISRASAGWQRMCGTAGSRENSHLDKLLNDHQVRSFWHQYKEYWHYILCISLTISMGCMAAILVQKMTSTNMIVIFVTSFLRKERKPRIRLKNHKTKILWSGWCHTENWQNNEKSFEHLTTYTDMAAIYDVTW